MLSKKQLQDVCMLHNGAQECRYLDSVDYTKHCCLKHRKEDKKKIDDAVDKYVADCRKKSIDPIAQGQPIGDHCPGYPYLKHIEQGYDKDKKP